MPSMLPMKKEFVVKSIDSAPDGAPYVVLSLSSLKDLKDGNQIHLLLLVHQRLWVFQT